MMLTSIQSTSTESVFFEIDRVSDALSRTAPLSESSRLISNVRLASICREPESESDLSAGESDVTVLAPTRYGLTSKTSRAFWSTILVLSPDTECCNSRKNALRNSLRSLCTLGLSGSRTFSGSSTSYLWLYLDHNLTHSANL